MLPLMFKPMKKRLSLLLMFSFGVFVACTDIASEDENVNCVALTGSDMRNVNKVSYDDVLSLCQCQDTITRSSSEVPFEIECITSESEDTLLYVSKKLGGGWTIYSSDTRVPAIVAQSTSGSFDNLMKIDAAKLWIQAMAEDMSVIRDLADDELNFTQQEIDNNKAFWKSISSPDDFVQDNLLRSTRASRALGHYEVISSTTYSEVYDSIGRMTETNWSQGKPYNIYCPLKSNNSEHAPAGCSAIAAAQMLYFLHDHLGVPTTAPSEAYCEGNINSYTWEQTNYTSEIWGLMNSNGVYAAPLIADIGRRLGIKYGDSGSSASATDLVKKVFNSYGISCTYDSYTAQKAINSLSDNVPVVLVAWAKDTTNTGSINNVGHAFIADRYKRTVMVTKNILEWVYDSIPNKPVPYITRESYTYSSPSISMIGMNWGWGKYYNDSTEWLSLTGDWVSQRSYTKHNWNIDRHIIHGFQVIE
jgi:hypothetical protein